MILVALIVHAKDTFGRLIDKRCKHVVLDLLRTPERVLNKEHRKLHVAMEQVTISAFFSGEASELSGKASELF